MNLGIYIHLPYCIHRCVYCDFNAYALKTKQELTSYIIALKKEILFYAQKISNTKIVDTLYFGGGTPSVHSSEQIQELVNLLRTEFNVSPSLEITLEANPSSLSLEKLKAFKDARINRLSLGVQTFHPQHLKTLERVHSAKQAEEAYRMAQEVGFKNINLDFIFGIPQQSLEEFKKDIKKSTTRFNPYSHSHLFRSLSHSIPSQKFRPCFRVAFYRFPSLESLPPFLQILSRS